MLLRQVQRRLELHKEAGTADDVLASTNGLKRKWQRRRGARLNSAEKKLFLPAKTDSSDDEEFDKGSSETENMSINEGANSPEGTGGDTASPTTLPSDPHNSNKSKTHTTELVYDMADITASLASQKNLTHQHKVKGEDSMNAAMLATKDGHGIRQEIDEVLEQQVHTCHYISVDRLPEIQVNKMLASSLDFFGTFHVNVVVFGLQYGEYMAMPLV